MIMAAEVRWYAIQTYSGHENKVKKLIEHRIAEESGGTPEEKEISEVLVPTPAIRVPSYNLAFLPHFQSMSEEAFQALADSKPLRREFLLKMGRAGS